MTHTGSRPSTLIVGLGALVIMLGLAPPASAFHLFRGNEAEPNCDPACALPNCSVDTCCSAATNATQPICCPATGNLGDTVLPSNIGAVVKLLHFSFNDTGTLSPAEVSIKVGQAVQWQWASSHCHSVTADDLSFDSGFFYPLHPPTGQQKAVKGVVDYPLLDPSPTLTFTHVFNQAGTFTYHCVHHQIVGMEGVVIVNP